MSTNIVVDEETGVTVDFSRAKLNPYYDAISEPVAVRLTADVIGYFAEMAADTGRPADRLMAACLREYAIRKKRPGGLKARHEPKRKTAE